MAGNERVFIRVAREGEFASIEGWYEPVDWKERSNTFQTLRSALAASEEQCQYLANQLREAHAKLNKIEDIIGVAPF